MRLGAEFRPAILRCAAICLRLLYVLFIGCLVSLLIRETQVRASRLPAANQATPEPTWSLDLHPLGFGLDQQKPFKKTQPPYAFTRFTDHAIAFTSAGQVAIVFKTLTMKGNTGYVPGTAIIHLVSIDAASGKMISAKQRTGNEDASITATPSGNILYEDDTQLVLYTPQLEAIASFPVQRKQQDRHLPVCCVNSADGRYVLLQEEEDKGQYIDTLVDADTLHSIRSWASGFPIYAFSMDNFVRWQLPSDSQQRSFYVQREGAEWRQFYEDSGCPWPNASAVFATEIKVAMVSCNEVALMDLRAHISFSQKFAKNYELGDLRTAANGRTLAISSVELKKQPFWVGDPGYDEVRPRLIVYDTQTGQAMWSLVLNPKYKKPLSYGLSTDGAQLALLRNGILELYRISAAQ